MNLYARYFKRLIDFLLALLAFTLLLPVIGFITLLLLMANRGEPFFFQRRPGRHGRIFWLVKFRTMNNRKDAAGQLLPDGVRLTAVGRFIRKTSLDELPQLINVIKGDMSLIGPRPLLVEYLPLYSPVQNRRHEVRPGITGWAQVNGRNAIGWEEKFELDVYYVDHISSQLDAKVILLTIKKVFKTEGISQQGHATMPAFKGAKQV
ncbi:sugar transferase [Paraflavitalea sp. CAU 1676]|jgi:lipopolysaccharide/colanic/teichoic acid biosynthesis glycosyltransferase|uniref:sugar transferase n=1 Tax=Paraflavitalea sp. CAU 1676 TaxID=3032598 RepID=UPI0023DBEBE9|nr:sugar transferase [Paraflavitalea sp. CAU 1676]MDF2189670.1 sugar transferase [Paraflavitalea sp. CAU 1676]